MRQRLLDRLLALRLPAKRRNAYMVISRAFSSARKRSRLLRCCAGDMSTVGMIFSSSMCPPLVSSHDPPHMPCRSPSPPRPTPVAIELTTDTREGVCIILGADGTAVGRCMGRAGCALHDEQHVAYDVDVAPSSTFHNGDKTLISPPGTVSGRSHKKEEGRTGTHFAASSYSAVGFKPAAACCTPRPRRGICSMTLLRTWCDVTGLFLFFYFF